MRHSVREFYWGIACPNLVQSHYGQFYGASEHDVREKAKAAGWAFGRKRGEAVRCPKCGAHK
jgi:hypothetical protein